MNFRKGPDVTDIYMTPIAFQLLLYRVEKNQWKDPFSILEIKDEDIIVLTTKGGKEL